MSDDFVGEIKLVGFNFAPKGWAECNGTIYYVQAQAALFSLLGHTCGGDGQTSESRDISGSVFPALYSETADTQMRDSSISDTGAGYPFGIESPYLPMLYVIALTGQYPPRN